MNNATIIPPDVVGLPPLNSERVRAAKPGTTPKENPNRRRTADRFAVLNAFLDMTAADLTRAEIVVWLILYRDTKADGVARTAQSDIARRAGTADRNVRRALDRLIELGLVRIVWQGGFRKGSSVYAVEPVPTRRQRT
jgi:hypothetical protein